MFLEHVLWLNAEAYLSCYDCVQKQVQGWNIQEQQEPLNQLRESTHFSFYKRDDGYLAKFKDWMISPFPFAKLYVR